MQNLHTNNKYKNIINNNYISFINKLKIEIKNY